VQYRFTFRLLPLLLVVVFDLGVGLARTTTSDGTFAFQVFYAVFGICFACANATIGCFFLYVAVSLSRPLFEYMRKKRTVPDRGNDPAFRRIYFVIKVLGMNGACLIILFAVNLWFISIVRRGVPTTMEYGVFTVCSALSRVATSYWHCQVIRPSMGPTSTHFAFNLLRGFFPSRVLARVGCLFNRNRVEPSSDFDTITSTSPVQVHSFSINLPPQGGCLEELSTPMPPVEAGTAGDDELRSKAEQDAELREEYVRPVENTTNAPALCDL